MRRRAVWLALSLFTVAVAAALASPAFRLSGFELVGARELTLAEIQQLTGLEVGRPLWLLDLRRAARALSASPWVERVRLYRRWPSRLVVEVVERRAVVLVPYQQYVLAVDRQGLALGLFDSDSAPDLPVLTGPVAPEVLLGERIDMPSLETALGVLSGLGEHARRIVEVNVGVDGRLSLYTRDPFPIYLGQAEGALAKIPRLVAVLNTVGPPPQPIEYIDLSANAPPVIKPRGR